MLEHNPELRRLFHLALNLSRIAGKEKEGIIEMLPNPAFEKELCRIIKKDLSNHKKLCGGSKKIQKLIKSSWE